MKKEMQVRQFIDETRSTYLGQLRCNQPFPRTVRQLTLDESGVDEVFCTQFADDDLWIGRPRADIVKSCIEEAAIILAEIDPVKRSVQCSVYIEQSQIEDETCLLLHFKTDGTSITELHTMHGSLRGTSTGPPPYLEWLDDIFVTEREP